MIGIKAIASHIPSRVIDNIAQGERFEEPESFIRGKIGALQLPLLEDYQDTSDLAVAATRTLIETSDLELDDVDLLVLVTQNGDGDGLPHTSAIVHGKLQLNDHVAAFDISLGCSGYVYGLSIVKGLMEQMGLRNGILVTADPYSKVVQRDDRVTSLLFGDAATATWLCPDGEWKIGQPLLQTEGRGANNLFVEDGKLTMNGRQVFNFASKQVPAQINAWLEKNEMDCTDIDFFCLHQGSSSIIDTIAKRFPAVRDRFIKDMADTGNTVSSSIPLLLEKHVLHSSAKKVLLSGFGVGLSWATNLMYRED